MATTHLGLQVFDLCSICLLSDDDLNRSVLQNECFSCQSLAFLILHYLLDNNDNFDGVVLRTVTMSPLRIIDLAQENSGASWAESQRLMED